METLVTHFQFKFDIKMQKFADVIRLLDTVLLTFIGINEHFISMDRLLFKIKLEFDMKEQTINLNWNQHTTTFNFEDVVAN